MSNRYSRQARHTISKTMHQWKAGTLRSGRSGRAVKARKQALAIGLSRARRAAYKVPEPKVSS